MTTHKDAIPLEQALERYYSAPVPRTEFLANLEQSLQAGPGALSQSSPKPRRPITFRPAYAFLTVGIILIVSLLVVGPANVVAALQGLIRYIPGFGLVDEKAALRVLAEPVTVTRDGVTVVVQQAVLSPEQLSITYIMKNIPGAAKPEWVPTERDKICRSIPEIHLPDGTRLEQQGGGRGGYDADNNSQYVVKFPAIPSRVDQASLFLPCLPDTMTGKAPSDWEIPLRFIPAPSNLTLLPVDEITPSPVTVKTTAENPLSLDRVVETQDGYIFIGQFRQVLPVQVTHIQPKILDVNGLLQGYTIPADIHTSPDITQTIEWAYQINTKDVAWPVTIRFNNASVDCTDPQAKITFDPGPNPQPGQVWEINQDFSIDPCQFRVQFVKWMEKGYLIRITDLVNTYGVQVSPWIEGQMLVGAAGGMTTQYLDHLDVSATFDQGLPKGAITLYMSAYGSIPGPWQVQWQPGR